MAKLGTILDQIDAGQPGGLVGDLQVSGQSVDAQAVVELRRIHKSIDEATVRAYGWDDLLDQLDHGFHPAGRDVRYTIGPAAQREILDRLLELNHERYEAEVEAGLHAKKSRRAKRATDEGTLF